MAATTPEARPSLVAIGLSMQPGDSRVMTYTECKSLRTSMYEAAPGSHWSMAPDGDAYRITRLADSQPGDKPAGHKQPGHGAAPHTIAPARDQGYTTVLHHPRCSNCAARIQGDRRQRNKFKEPPLLCGIGGFQVSMTGLCPRWVADPKARHETRFYVISPAR